MKNVKWKLYGLWVLLTEAVGALAGWLTRKQTRVYNETAAKPPLSPPPAVFPVVWAILYVLMGVGAARVWQAPASPERTRGLWLFFGQLAVNFLWSIIFFNLGQYGFAFAWLMLLWLLVLGMILAFGRVDRTAALLQLPYLVWVTFAAYLNFGTWMLNR